MTSYAGSAPARDGVGTLLAAVYSIGVQSASRRGRVLAPRGRHVAVPEVPRESPEPGDTRDEAPGGARDQARDEEVWGLVEAAQQGDVEAFGRLYDRYVDVVHRYAYARLGDRTLAEDVTSETFLRALRRIGTVSYRGRDVGAWFVTIARNLVLDHVKSGRNRYEVVSGDPVEPDRTIEGPEPAVLRRISSEELLRCVRQLPPDQQECVVLRFLQGLSVAETAAVMNRNTGAVKALQHRALRRLHGLMPEGLQ
jgi:RNA polymerase sigma-70 factor, ECF subfamily